MRSSLHNIKQGQLGSHSQIGSFGSMSMIRNNSNVISKQSKFSHTEEIGTFSDKLFGTVGMNEKDITDARKYGYSYRKYENGDIYYGQMENDKPHGQGVYIYWATAADKKPYFYKGSFENGEFNGFGKFCKLLNEREAMYCYQGNWKAHKKEGEGKQNYNIENTMFYKGNFANDQRQDFGTLVMPDGAYEGNWRQGRMTGEGSMIIERGPFKKIISGQWIDDEILQGVIKYLSKPNNNIIGEYRGAIRNLVRHGQGQYQTGSCIVKGNFLDDELVGTSTISNISGAQKYTLTGDITQDRVEKLDGQIWYGNRDRYQGQLQITPNNIIRRTKGKYFFTNGQVVQASFEDNEKGELRRK